MGKKVRANVFLLIFMSYGQKKYILSLQSNQEY